VLSSQWLFQRHLVVGSQSQIEFDERRPARTHRWWPQRNMPSRRLNPIATMPSNSGTSPYTAKIPRIPTPTRIPPRPARPKLILHEQRRSCWSVTSRNRRYFATLSRHPTPTCCQAWLIRSLTANRHRLQNHRPGCGLSLNARKILQPCERAVITRRDRAVVGPGRST